MKLTEASVGKVKRQAAGKSDHIEWDDALPGFGLRVRDGRATWIVQYKIGAKHRRITLGSTEQLTAEQARYGWKSQDGKKLDGADKILANKRDGVDAAVARAERRREASETLGAIVAAFLDAKEEAFRPRSFREIKRHLRVHWKPLHDSPVAAVTRELIAAQVAAIAKGSGNTTANRARASLSAMYRWAIGEGLCDDNPVLGTNKRIESGPRERSLSDEELASVWNATSDNDYGRIVRLLVLTGCRRDEIGLLRWSEIDIEAKTIAIPKERTKNKNEHILSLSDMALEIISGLTRTEDREFLFGRGRNGFAGWSKSKGELEVAAKLKEPWRLHDLRRTVRTGLGQLGVLPHVAEAVLNHLPPKLIRTYDRSTYAAEKKAALDAWATHVKTALAKAGGTNVIGLKKARV